MSMNRWIGVGKVSEPIISETGNGAIVANFTLQCVDGYTDKNGDRKETIEYVAIAAWRTQAIYVSENIHKNDIVGITGKLRTRTIPGASKSVQEVLADAVTLIHSNRRQLPVVESSGHTDDLL